MTEYPLINPKTVTVPTMDGGEVTVHIGRLAAWDGRKFAALYLPSALPKVGDYATNAECARMLFSHVDVVLEGGATVRLTTEALINNHFPEWETLARVEKEAIEHNTSFFKNGGLSTFCEPLVQRAVKWLISTLMPSLDQFLKKVGQPSGN